MLTSFIKAKYDARAFAASGEPAEWLADPCLEMQNGWFRYIDEGTGSFYYFNVDADTTVWDMPADAQEPASLECILQGVVAARRSTVVEESQIVYAGWLTKAAPQKFARSRQRWFVLQKNRQLRYYEDETRKEVKGVIDLSGVRPRDIQLPKPSSGTSLLIYTADRKWQLDAGSRESLCTWHQHIMAGIHR